MHAKPRHRATRRAPLRSMLTITSAVAGATLIGLGAAGSTLALWQDTEALPDAPTSSGYLNLFVNSDVEHQLSSAVWQNMLPGDRVQQPVNVLTEGTVPTDVSVTTTASPDLAVRVLRGDCPVGNTALKAPDSNGTAADVGDWGAGESSIACIEVTLKSSASASVHDAELPIIMRFTAVQATS